MKFTIKREHLLPPLQQLSNILSGRQTLAILENLLLQVTKNHLLITSTDLEIEIVARISLITIYELGVATVPARKFLDICRSLSDGAEINVMLEGERIIVHCRRSKFSLATKPAYGFPNQEPWQSNIEFSLAQGMLKHLIEATYFSMANKDVRHYLNGMLFETERDKVRMIATDGHRLSVSSISVDTILPLCAAIIPRKGVIELMRILDRSDRLIKLQIGSNNIRAILQNYIFTSKLIDGCFPDYRSVLPKNPDKSVKASCNMLKQSLTRAVIISNEKFRGIRLYLSWNQLKITAKNSEEEKVEELLDVIYEGCEIEIYLNVSYVIDVLNALKCKYVHILITDAVSSIQIEDSITPTSLYVIMPMRL